MSNITVKFNPMSTETVGFVTCNLPDDILEVLNAEVQAMIDTDFKQASTYNTGLVGAIEKEFVITKSVDKLNKFFNAVIPEYWKLQGKKEESQILYQISFNSLKNVPDVWVNLQKKYEYNPLHSHGGALSFIVYLKIPYDLDTEVLLPHVRTHKLAPALTFVYPSIRGSNSVALDYRVHIDKDWEGTMIIFPAWLNHMVTPFYTSDDYRISVAGNLSPVHFNG